MIDRIRELIAGFLSRRRDASLRERAQRAIDAANDVSRNGREAMRRQTHRIDALERWMSAYIGAEAKRDQDIADAYKRQRETLSRRP